MKIPKQYLPIVPYLILSNSKGFLEFVKTVFDAKEQYMAKHENDDIQHGEIKIQDAVIMFSQSNENWGNRPAGMFIFVEDVDKIYDAGLRHNCISLMIPQKKEYGYTAGFEDPFGNQWWLVEGGKE
ncbi:VOC family protein [Flavobacterium psychrotolerans]|uniref:Transposase n=1 Tax=Flavobacterium psychrotolerans TaxID=2169410 RepID=A0A2U1JHR8_9FLAO|nr:VOC family protein [Flavobacterium psychrotolerans]PWA04672.1 transposase [Flavobacterium psychrotolerans]